MQRAALLSSHLPLYQPSMILLFSTTHLLTGTLCTNYYHQKKVTTIA